MKIANVYVKKYEKGKLLGFVDIGISFTDTDENHMVIKSCKIFKDKNGNPSVAMPTIKDEKGGKTEDGNDKYWATIIFPKDNEVSNKFIKSLNKKVAEALNRVGEEKTPTKTPTAKTKPSATENNDYEDYGF